MPNPLTIDTVDIIFDGGVREVKIGKFLECRDRVDKI